MKLLGEDRKKEISLQLHKDWQDWKKISSKIWESNKITKFQKFDYSEPLWQTFATAIPVDKNKPAVRACLAFYKTPCEFKRKTKGKGCTHCALSIRNKDLSEVSSLDQIKSFRKAVENVTANLGYTPQIIEILPDGSFLNEKEIPYSTQKEIFDYIRTNKDILKVAIESRVEYINLEKIRRLLNLLRKDQILEIYVGLESVDDFVISKIIKKGVTVKQYEKLITLLAENLSEEEKNRLHLSVYHFFKPPYLTEKEAIQTAISMSKQVKNYVNETGLQIFVKYEPAVISEGTFHKYLFEKGQFIPPNYFSVAEVIASSYYYGFSDIIKFGQRDDIDDFQKVANIPHLSDPNLFSPFDFLVYNAVQRFNADQDVRGFCADLSLVFEKSQEFRKWEKEIYGKDGISFLSKLFDEYKSNKFDSRYRDRILFQKVVREILDKLEYGENIFSSNHTEKLILNFFYEKILKEFESKNIRVLQLKNFNLIPVNETVSYSKLLQGEIIIENEVGLPQNIWVGIPINFK